MEDQNQQNPEDVVAFDVPMFIRLLEFAREDATDDEALHKATDKIIELCQDGQVLTMDQYDEIVAGNTKIDTSNMNAVDDNMQEQNKTINAINEKRWMKLAGIINEEEDYDDDMYDSNDYPDSQNSSFPSEEFNYNIGDYVEVFLSRSEGTKYGRVKAFNEYEGVVVTLDNGENVEVSPYAVELAPDPLD